MKEPLRIDPLDVLDVLTIKPQPFGELVTKTGYIPSQLQLALVQLADLDLAVITYGRGWHLRERRLSDLIAAVREALPADHDGILSEPVIALLHALDPQGGQQ